jgi:hypothetical protein
MANNEPENEPHREPSAYYRQDNPYGGYLPTPNSTEVLVLGILTIVFCWCYGIVSVILGIVTLVLAGEGEKKYRLSPHLYSESSYKNLKAGKTCAIVGISLAALSILFVIIWLVLFGTLLFNFPALNIN